MEPGDLIEIERIKQLKARYFRPATGPIPVGYQNASGASVGRDESLEFGHYAASRHT